jgi:ADP-heptose:LPS heptosyltransferase/glycosyltransferase involved in cell wall biosynthesis
MNKLLLRAPVLTASGYGVHARQILQALLAADQFDISIDPMTWGQTPFIYESTDLFQVIHSLIEKKIENDRNGVRYDLSVQVTIPNEFQKLAALNIGVTAGIEVDRVSAEWIKKVNETVDLLIVPSKHSAEAFSIVYRANDGKTLRLEKPLAICPEGIDTRIFRPSAKSESKVIDKISQLPTKFNFLGVGLGLDKTFGEDRKNIGLMVKWFLETFAGNKDVGLILKASIVNNSLMDFETIKRRLEEIRKTVGCGPYPMVHLVHGRLSDSEMAGLYSHESVKAFVTLTHGEGFGLPIIEAAACDLPVVATNWSGHLDFLNIEGKKRFVAVEFDLKEIPDSAVWNGVMDPGTKWANAREDDFKNKLKKVYLSYDFPKKWAQELGTHVRENFNLQKVCYNFFKTVADFCSSRFSQTSENLVGDVRQKLGIKEGDKTLLYTMPMSAGDVFISTAIVNSLKKEYPEHQIFFATSEKYISILKNNTDIHRVIQFENWMGNVPFLEQIFDEVYTPNLAIQMLSSNWVRRGKGRLLGNEMAYQCSVPFGEYRISLEKPNQNLPDRYIVLQPGSGKGQWEARNYLSWQEVVLNLKEQTGLPVVQVGLEDDPLYEGVIDLRGKTSYNQLAYVINESDVFVGIDSVGMHMAAALEIPHVAIFGSSYATSTGPVLKKEIPSILLETEDRYGCEKACYKYQCFVKKDHPCLNEISAKKIVDSVVMAGKLPVNKTEYTEYVPKISGYTHILNPESAGFPYVESIRSMLGFCDEVVVVDGGSTDGSLQKIEEIGDHRVKVMTREWDWSEPGMDGMQKAYGRAMCSGEFLWQQDCDEIVHEDDYGKIRSLVKKFPRDVDLVSLPVVELWGNEKNVRTDRHSWKWRLSRNNFRITHGINKDARVFDEKTGRMYAKKGMSDGCEYVDVMTGEYIPHKNFYTNELEFIRRKQPEKYGEAMNQIFQSMPSVYHYSWMDLQRKIRNFKSFWNKCWANLYNESPVDRFPDVTDDSSTVFAEAADLFIRGGEHGDSKTFRLNRSNPSVMKSWIEKSCRFGIAERQAQDDSGHIRNDQESSRPSEEVAPESTELH